MLKVKMIKSFNIKQYERAAVYQAVGAIIENAQNWEKEFRICAVSLGVKMNNIERKTLVKINQKLKKKKLIVQREFDVLNEIINLRNDVNHTFFIGPIDQCKTMNECETEEDWANLNAYLNTVNSLIFEARDIVNNITNKDNPNHTHVYNILDE